MIWQRQNKALQSGNLPPSLLAGHGERGGRLRVGRMLTDWMSRTIPRAVCACVNPISENFSISHLLFTEVGAVCVCVGGLRPFRSHDTFARVLHSKQTLQARAINGCIYFIYSSPACLSACLLFQLKYYLQIISGVCFHLRGSSAEWGGGKKQSLLIFYCV